MNSMYKNYKNEKVNHAILISGSARSGTTIVGKLIHSFKNVEYAFEPPLLFSLFSMIDYIDKEQWMKLYEEYLYEDFFLNAISGRNINVNRSDDSSIYSVKSADEIKSRLQNSIRHNDAEVIGKTRVIAYKMPDIVPYIPNMLELYPGTRVVMVRRSAMETINSIIKKKWFSDKNLSSSSELIKGKGVNIFVPFWVDNLDSEKWINMTELDRCAYYYIRVSSNIQNSIELQYENFVQNPYESAKDLAIKLGLEFGEKTQDIIDSIKPSIKARDNNIINKISPELRQAVIKSTNNL
jgi:hypothetical protein